MMGKGWANTKQESISAGAWLHSDTTIPCRNSGGKNCTKELFLS